MLLLRQLKLPLLPLRGCAGELGLSQPWLTGGELDGCGGKHRTIDAMGENTEVAEAYILFGPQTVDDWAGFCKLMVHALLPMLNMDWNVVDLKRSMAPRSRKDQTTDTSL
ncbi:unnamed protein product [Pleuronectes platessa]|uniref:Uncharacterized protein n=1 Tax=Pleuronectes platessa TaxID=8262 RepID=A0A9N7YD82_PLEPL|nr:unnamed protein product [Pleuronectes platessa]